MMFRYKTSREANAGATGIGAGNGYMGDNGFYVDIVKFGTPR